MKSSLTKDIVSVLLIWLCLAPASNQNRSVVEATSTTTATATTTDIRRTEVVQIITSITNYNHCNAKCVTSVKSGSSTGCQGFVGDDCSFRYEICPDSVTQCFGTMAVCIDDEGGDQTSINYKCDCKAPYSINTTTLMEEFQIQDCKDRVTEICEKDQTVSRYAFCTNGGRCAEQIEPGEPHPGCLCPGECYACIHMFVCVCVCLCVCVCARV